MNNEAGNVKCPFYISHTTNKKAANNNITVTCEFAVKDIGFEMQNRLSFANRNERRDYMELFCMDRFECCPYYRFIRQNRYKED